MRDRNVGIDVAGSAYFTAPVTFNFGGRELTAAQATTEELERAADAYRREVGIYSNRSLGALAVCGVAVMLCVPITEALLLWFGLDSTAPGYREERRWIFLTLAPSALVMTLVIVGDWWRLQRAVLRVLRREQAVVLAQLGIRKRLEANQSADNK
ncbi:hypothetical protein [Vulcaniibacterium tengchongense]|uniref:Uncharacterized protein n=1 Tax=Vulcaniibacterium tengchongense TaxID=1273429 RepID=A0A3N4V4H5_9GAMM|nr:hypothetical protein [Vulcaniibacterium tengchongense]RPE74641.1 hypothetical protein EDC50_3170 [Vulcaniibacterium tengchongense]